MKRQQEQLRLIKIMLFTAVILCGGLLIYFFLTHRFYKYESPQEGFRISYPIDWEYKENQYAASVIFFSPKSNDLDIFRENVSVVVQDIAGKDYTIEQFSEMAIDQMSKLFKGRMEILKNKSTRLAGRPAHLFMYVGNEMDNEVQFLHVWTLYKGKVYQLTYTGNESEFSKFLLKARMMIRSFRFI